MATAAELAEKLERLAAQATCRSVAAEQVRLAQEDVQRIQRIGTETEEAERETEELAKKIIEAEQALNAAKGRQTEADAALKAAEEAARAEGSDSGVTDTVVRQQLELRKSAADQAALEAQQRIDAAVAAQKLVEAAGAAERDLQDQEAKARTARGSRFQCDGKAERPPRSDFADATCLSGLLTFRPPTSASQRLRLLSTNSLSSTVAWRPPPAIGPDWPGSAPRLQFRHLARSAQCDNSRMSLPLRAAPSTSVLWLR